MTAIPDNEGNQEPKRLRIELLGGFHIAFAGSELPSDAWRSRNASSLIKRLALERECALPREQLSGLFWPESSHAAGLNNLRQTVYLARRQLEYLPLDPALLLRSQGSRIQLYPPDTCEIDVHAFEDAARQARGSIDPAHYWTAIERYHGALLPDDLYVEWTDVPRTSLETTYLGLLADVAQMHEARGEPQQAIAALRRLVAIEPTDEAAHVRLMRLLTAIGNRPLALEQYRLLEGVLARTLGVAPEPETQALYRRIKASGGRAVANPALVDARRSPGNLPHPVSRFIGREQEVAAVAEQLGRHRLVTLTGPGGIGKTRLALEVAERAAAKQTDGAWLVRLAGVFDPALVPQAVIDALGLDGGPQQPPLETLLASLRDADLLLFLDNCEHLIDACVELVEMVLQACPAVRVLATSRELLRVRGECPWAVPVLRLPSPGAPLDDIARSDSVQLFLDRAAPYRPGISLTPENLNAVCTICRRLDGLPLALELAASRAAVLSLTQLATRLDDALGLLTGGARQAPTRQQTLRAALDWSYQLLTIDERVLFRRLAVFADGWTLAMAESICSGEGLAASTILDLHGQLVAKSLVQAVLDGDEARYRLLEPVRQYAIELRKTSGEDARLRARHAAYFADFVEAIEAALSGPAQVGWFTRLEQEYDNIQAALSWAIEQAEADLALRIEAVLWRYWSIRWHSAAGLAVIEGTLALPGSSATRARAWALLGAGELARRILDFSRSISLTEESLALFRALDDTSGVAWSLAYLANSANVASDFDRARTCAGESLELFRTLGDQPGIARSLNILAEVARVHDDYQTAGRFYRAALEIDRQLGDQQNIAVRLHNLAYVALHDGDVDLAMRSFAEAYRLDRELGYRTGPLSFLEGMAAAMSAAGRHRLSARLSGAWEANSGLPGAEFKLHPADQREFDRYTAQTAAALGSERCAREWEAGRQLSLEEAAAEALTALGRAVVGPSPPLATDRAPVAPASSAPDSSVSAAH
jgi:predicted ATPase/DNA-binding SARP family transcriptional activator